MKRQALTAAELARNQPVQFALKLRNFEELSARVQRGEVISLDEMGSRYLPAREAWQKVATWARAQGFAVNQEDASHMTVFASGSVAQVQSKLQMRFARVIGTDGAEYTSAITPPSVPAEFSDTIIAVRGIQPHLRPKKHQTITPVAIDGPLISPKTIAQLYNAADLGLDGIGETIVILGGARIEPSDLSAFWQKCGLPTTLDQFTELDPYPAQLGSTGQASEETMDVEWASAMAPRARIIYLSSVDFGTLTSWLVQRVATDGTIHQINESAGLSEACYYNGRAVPAESQYRAAIAALGITLFVSSGDEGSTANVVGNQLPNWYYDPNGTTSPDYPASDPFVTAVGGTTVVFGRDGAGGPTLPVVEGGWCLPNGRALADDFGAAASGGGISRFFSRPTWQSGPGLPSGSMRCVPDVAAMAMGNFGAFYYFGGQPYTSSGTSLSSPIWTGLCALINQARRSAGLGPVGLLGPRIYPLNGTASFNQMTTGSADGSDGFSTTARNGAYVVGPNYNLVTGLGSPNVGNLVAALTTPQTGTVPVITVQPVTQNAAVGGSAIFTVAATGDPAPSYWWTFNGAILSDGPQFDGSIISGAATSALTISNAQGVDNFNQRVAAIAGNERGVATSDEALLMVTRPGTAVYILRPPSDQSTAVGGSAKFVVAAFGSPPLSYQWTKNGIDIAGAVGPIWTIATVSASDAGSYAVRVSNALGEMTSASASLTVTTLPVAPTILTQPQSRVVVDQPGAGFLLSVVASGTGPLRYQWYWNGTPVPQGTGADLTLTSTWIHSGDSFWVLVSNGVGSVTSDTATLTVRTLQPPAVRAASLVATNGFTANWDGEPGVLGYRLDVSAASDFGAFVAGYQDVDVGLATNWSVSGLNAGTTYYYRVRAYVNTLTSGNSSTVSVTTTGAPAFTSAASTTFFVGVPSSFTVTANGGPAPTFRATGLPSWASFNAVTGLLGGTAPNTNGAPFAVSFTASNGIAPDATQSFTLNVRAAPDAAVPLTVTTLAGLAGSSGSTDATGSAARFNFPTADAVDEATGLAYIADTENHTIRTLTPGGTAATLAGLAETSGSEDGLGAAARFDSPSGIAIDSVAGVGYVADTANHTIRKITPAGVVTTLAGRIGTAGSDDGAGNAARFFGPQGLALDEAGNLYVADTNNDTIRKITPAGVVTTVAGTAGQAGGADGIGSAARFNAPTGVATDSSGHLFVADSENNLIRRIVLASGTVSTLAGRLGSVGTTDGIGSAATFNQPSALAADSAGNLYVADTDNHTIRRIAPDTGLVTTVAGLPGSAGSTDGVGGDARFRHPAGIAVDASDNLYIADTDNHTLRLGFFPAAPAITTQPRSQTVTAGSNVQFSVTASGRPVPTYQWSFNGAAVSGANGSTLSLTNVQAGNAGSYTVTATNTSGSVTSSVATLTVNTAPTTSLPSGGGSGGGGGGGTVEAWFVAALALLAAGRWAAWMASKECEFVCRPGR